MPFVSPSTPVPMPSGGDTAPRQSVSRIRKTRLGGMPIHPGSSRAMLSIPRGGLPAWAPRMHLGKRLPDGSFAVLDRATGERFVVYTPRFEPEFAAGTRPFQWYIRPANLEGGRPASVPFATARAALGALERGLWRVTPTEAPRRPGKPLRVIWSTP